MAIRIGSVWVRINYSQYGSGSRFGASVSVSSRLISGFRVGLGFRNTVTVV